jgi:hypothetical protein
LLLRGSIELEGAIEGGCGYIRPGQKMQLFCNTSSAVELPIAREQIGQQRPRSVVVSPRKQILAAGKVLISLLLLNGIRPATPGEKSEKRENNGMGESEEAHGTSLSCS